MSGNPVYPQGELRPVLRQRFQERALRHPNRRERARARSLADALNAGQAVTVTLDELKFGLWHAALATSHELHGLHNEAAASRATHYAVAPDGGYTPA